MRGVFEAISEIPLSTRLRDLKGTVCVERLLLDTISDTHLLHKVFCGKPALTIFGDLTTTPVLNFETTIWHTAQGSKDKCC